MRKARQKERIKKGRTKEKKWGTQNSLKRVERKKGRGRQREGVLREGKGRRERGHSVKTKPVATHCEYPPCHHLTTLFLCVEERVCLLRGLLQRQIGEAFR